jgi:hypothetical protein
MIYTGLSFYVLDKTACRPGITGTRLMATRSTVFRGTAHKNALSKAWNFKGASMHPLK